MPKTANKRAEARKRAMVQRAHEVAPAVPSTPINRRVPLVQGRAVRRTPGSFISNYPWATSIFVLLLVGLVILVAYNQHLGPWAEKPKPTQATCNLQTHTCNKAPISSLDSKLYYSATIKTKYGDIVIQLDAANAPIAVNNFVFLAQQGFYNGLTFDRIEHPGEVSPVTNQPSNLNIIQGGTGGKDFGPGYKLKFDSNYRSYTAGVVAVANESQFFICLSDQVNQISTSFDVFGYVTAGLDVAKKIQLNDVMESITISTSSVQPTPGPTAIPPTATPAPTTPPTATATP